MHRLLRIGFEVRLTVLTVDGQEVSVVLTRTHARSLGIERGQHGLADAGDRRHRDPADGARRRLTTPVPVPLASLSPLLGVTSAGTGAQH